MRLKGGSQLRRVRMADGANRANAAVLGNADSGQTWNSWAGTTLGILSNKIEAQAAGNKFNNMLEICRDGVYEFTVSKTGGSPYWYLYLRGDTLLNSSWLVYCNPDTPGITLVRNNQGTSSTKITYTSGVGGVASGSRVALRVLGNSYELFLNGTSQGTFTASAAVDTTARVETALSPYTYTSATGVISSLTWTDAGWSTSMVRVGDTVEDSVAATPATVLAVGASTITIASGLAASFPGNNLYVNQPFGSGRMVLIGINYNTGTDVFVDDIRISSDTGLS